MQEYKKYLEKHGVKSKYHIYSIAWVKQHAKYCQDHKQDYWATESLKQYLSSLSRHAETWH